MLALRVLSRTCACELLPRRGSREGRRGIGWPAGAGTRSAVLLRLDAEVNLHRVVAGAKLGSEALVGRVRNCDAH